MKKASLSWWIVWLVSLSLTGTTATASAQDETHDASYYAGRAHAKQAKGDLAGAIADFDRALELRPDDAETYSDRAVAKGAKDDVDGAIADHTRAIELDPNLAQSYSDRGLDKLSKGDLPGAAADCEKGVALDRSLADAWRDRAIVNQATNHWPEALRDHRRYRELALGSADYAYFYIWLMRARLGQTDAATKELAEHVDEIPKVEVEAWTRSVGEFLIGRLPEADFLALAISSEEKKNREQHCEAYYYVGMKSSWPGINGGGGPFPQMPGDGEKNVHGIRVCQGRAEDAGASVVTAAVTSTIVTSDTPGASRRARV